MTPTLAPSALEFAARSHATQLREGDGAPFIAHPVEVARLLRDAGCSEDLVAAGFLHDVVEDTGVSLEELARRFGAGVADLVGAVSDDERIEDYGQRKRALREQVRMAGHDAALLFAADKISKVREQRDRIVRARPTHAQPATLGSMELLRFEHYRRSLAMLRGVAPRHPLVRRLAVELSQTRRALGDAVPRSSRAARQRTRRWMVRTN